MNVYLITFSSEGVYNYDSITIVAKNFSKAVEYALKHIKLDYEKNEKVEIGDIKHLNFINQVVK